ncbi:MAG: hypothetical protein JWO12_2129 [Frankiales bacterium]|nr:hypothetical protein [Frankiales bacterium]
MDAVRRPALLAVAASLALLTACSDDGATAGPRRTPADLGRSSPYEKAVLTDGARALFPLRDADGLRPKDQIADLAAGKAKATVVGGTISGTSSPGGERGALFLRGGRIVTSLTTGFASTDAFSVEMQVRADACTTAWGRVLGTTDQTPAGREGMEVIHFPSQFTQNPCRLGVEIWHKNVYLGGCHPTGVPAIGRWFQLTLTYGSRHVTCYENGRLVTTEVLRAPGVFLQTGPLGIGGSGSGFQGPADGISLSEVGIYDRVLTVAEVRNHAGLLAQAAAPTPTAAPTRS